MIGSPVIAGWIAHLAFWALLTWGWMIGELGIRASAAVLAVWLIIFAGLVRIPYIPFASFVAVLDIVLVFVIFKSDVRLT
jgi:hypothetical protein